MLARRRRTNSGSDSQQQSPSSSYQLGHSRQQSPPPPAQSIFTDPEMTCRDRSVEFMSVVKSLQSRQGNGVVQNHKSKALHVRSEFTQIAKRIGKDLANTFAKLEKLTILAKRKAIFDDKPLEIQELTYIIKQDINSLNDQIAQLQQLAKSQKSQNGKHLQTHSNTVVVALQSKLASMSNDFRQVLEVRTENLKHQKSRREQFSSTPVTSSMPPSAYQGHMNGSVLLQDEASYNGQVAIDMTGGAKGGHIQSQMQLIDEQVSLKKQTFYILDFSGNDNFFFCWYLSLMLLTPRNNIWAELLKTRVDMVWAELLKARVGVLWAELLKTRVDMAWSKLLKARVDMVWAELLKIRVDMAWSKLLKARVDMVWAELLKARVDMAWSELLKARVDMVWAELLKARVDMVWAELLKARVDMVWSELPKVRVDMAWSELLKARVDMVWVELLKARVDMVWVELLKARVDMVWAEHRKARVDMAWSELLKARVDMAWSELLKARVDMVWSELLKARVDMVWAELLKARVDMVWAELLKARVDMAWSELPKARVDMAWSELLKARVDMVWAELLKARVDMDAYIQSRAETMQNIESTIVELGSIFQQLAHMVKEQEEVVGRIDQNVEEASLNIEAAHSEILKYFQSVTSNRWLMIKIFGVLMVFFIIFIVFMA
ncbi:syntaxin-5 [Biomphalaria pfeifferi]|uniref:Syntaxin-5 n=1 Tax=Biomphalaria pfeifferi TaxID=112525 RepID=A0AAD8F6D2_BIOPF|nr:syntaxin-5 [Biomphalaria pfeifferi]